MNSDLSHQTNQTHFLYQNLFIYFINRQQVTQQNQLLDHCSTGSRFHSVISSTPATLELSSLKCHFEFNAETTDCNESYEIPLEIGRTIVITYVDLIGSIGALIGTAKIAQFGLNSDEEYSKAYSATYPLGFAPNFGNTAVVAKKLIDCLQLTSIPMASLCLRQFMVDEVLKIKSWYFHFHLALRIINLIGFDLDKLSYLLFQIWYLQNFDFYLSAQKLKLAKLPFVD